MIFVFVTVEDEKEKMQRLTRKDKLIRRQ